MGFSIRTSHFYGAKNIEGVRRSIATTFLLCGILSVTLTVASSFAARPLLRLLNTPAEIFEDAYGYLGTIFLGMTATIFYNAVSQTMRALGDSRTPLIFLIIASGLNIGLDFLFILVFRMGTAGAGWATVTSQLLSGLACLVYMFRKFPELRLDKRAWAIKWHNCRKHLLLGIPMALQTSIIAVGMMVQSSALNGLGTTYVTAYTAASKLDHIMMQPMIAIGSALATFSGQNYGAREVGRIREGVRQGHLAALVCALIGFAVNVTLGRFITYLFVPDASAEVIALSSEYLFWQGVFYVALSFIHVYRNTLQGMGRSVLTIVGGAIELVMRVLASLLMVKWFGFTGLSLSNPLAWIGAAIFLFITYLVVMRGVLERAKTDMTARQAKLAYEKNLVASTDPNDEKVTTHTATDEVAATTTENGL